MRMREQTDRQFLTEKFFEDFVLTLEQARSGHPNTKDSLCQEKRIVIGMKDKLAI
jgi:hypothetical protein